jgi:hypothetical protein
MAKKTVKKRSGLPNQLIGQMFGRLTVISRGGKDKNRNALWNCRCFCGQECVVLGVNLKNGHTRHCGCQGTTKPSRRTKAERTNRTPPGVGPEGRKVTVGGQTHTLRKWANATGLHATTIASRLDEQQLSPEIAVNAHRDMRGRQVTLDGETMSLAKWCKRYGIKLHTVRDRLRHDWELERAIKTPARTRAT